MAPTTNPFSERCTLILKDHGYRITKTRRRIADAVMSFQQPFTPKDVHEVLDGLENCDFATVYRTLVTFHGLGIIHQVAASGKYLICNASHEDHGQKVHAIYRCEHCDLVEERQLDKEVMSMLFYLTKNLNPQFKTNSAVLDLSGTCTKCHSH